MVEEVDVRHVLDVAEGLDRERKRRLHAYDITRSVVFIGFRSKFRVVNE